MISRMVVVVLAAALAAAGATAHDDPARHAADPAAEAAGGDAAGATVSAPAPFDAAAQNAERHRLTEAFGWQLDQAEVTVESINASLHVLFGLGGNVLVSIGDTGTLMVDDQFPELVPKLLDAVRELGGNVINFVVNTHWHFDHADGNLNLGPGGAWLVSHEQSREMMGQTRVIDLVGIEYTQQAYPPEARPVITYDRAMRFHFNGEAVDLLHFGPAHTTGDTAVVFRGSNLVHLGDVYNNAGYPFIDVGNGGDLDGVIAFCRAVLAEIDAATVVVPGHGPLSDYQGLEAYVTMLQTVRDRIAELVGDGADLETVLAARPTGDYDDTYGDPARFVDRAYFSLTGGGGSVTE